MEDYMPQDEYFEWEDIVAYNAPRGMDEDWDNTHQVALPRYTASFPVSKPIALEDSPEEDSWWSDDESNISSSPSDFSTSHTTFLTLSVTTVCQSKTNDIVFPEYDTGGLYSSAGATPDIFSRSNQDDSDEDSSLEDEDLPMSPSPAPTFIPIEHTCDDIDLRPSPSGQVDYFSHDWEVEDICASWRHLVCKPSSYKHQKRLENAAWRSWTKIRNQLTTVTPKSINWMKELDDTALYGPFQVGSRFHQNSPSSPNHIRYSRFRSVSITYSSLRPVLKKPTISQILLRGSIPSLCTPNQAPKQAREVVITPPRAIHVPFKKMLARASSGSVAAAAASQPRARQVVFQEEVEQFKAIDFSQIEVKPEPRRWPKSFGFSKDRISPAQLAKTKTIEKLPPTTIRNIKRQRRTLNAFSKQKTIDLLRPDPYEWQDGHPAADLSEWQWMGEREQENELDWTSPTPGPRTYLTDLIHQTRTQVESTQQNPYYPTLPSSDLANQTLTSQPPSKNNKYLPPYHSNISLLPSHPLEDVLSADEQKLLEELELSAEERSLFEDDDEDEEIDMSSMSSMSPDTSDYQSSAEEEDVDDVSIIGGESLDISDQKAGLGMVHMNQRIPRIAIFEPMERTLFDRVMDEFHLVL